ncbi:hypothetical protein C0991_007015 [Blastosporella zonata]|nr:hypothetical protein C0991_007015 [Blastosporella zonata]
MSEQLKMVTVEDLNTILGIKVNTSSYTLPPRTAVHRHSIPEKLAAAHPVHVQTPPPPINDVKTAIEHDVKPLRSDAQNQENSKPRPSSSSWVRTIQDPGRIPSSSITRARTIQDLGLRETSRMEHQSSVPEPPYSVGKLIDMWQRKTAEAESTRKTATLNRSSSARLIKHTKTLEEGNSLAPPRTRSRRNSDPPTSPSQAVPSFHPVRLMSPKGESDAKEHVLYSDGDDSVSETIGRVSNGSSSGSYLSSHHSDDDLL